MATERVSTSTQPWTIRQIACRQMCPLNRPSTHRTCGQTRTETAPHTLPLPFAARAKRALAGTAGAAAPGARCGPVAGFRGPAPSGSRGRALRQGRARARAGAAKLRVSRSVCPLLLALAQAVAGYQPGTLTRLIGPAQNCNHKCRLICYHDT